MDPDFMVRVARLEFARIQRIYRGQLPALEFKIDNRRPLKLGHYEDAFNGKCALVRIFPHRIRDVDTLIDTIRHEIAHHAQYTMDQKSTKDWHDWVWQFHAKLCGAEISHHPEISMHD